MKIYTKTGDLGMTSLIGGKRVPKHYVRIEAYGTVDELNSFIGLLAVQSGMHTFADQLKDIQSTLFVIGSLLAADPEKSVSYLPELAETKISDLEQSIDLLTDSLPALTHFILPGGNPSNAHAHVCRSICRRAERRVTDLLESEQINPLIVKYLNRLSDWFFILARTMSYNLGTPEHIWIPAKKSE